MSRARREQRLGLAPARISTNGHSTNGETLAGDFVDQARLLAALRGIRAGDFGVRLPLDWIGVPGNVSEVFNEVVALNQRLKDELERISRMPGREGTLEQRAALGSVPGDWATTIDSINLVIANLSQSNANMRRQLTDLTQTHATVNAQLTVLTQSHADVRAQL